MVACVSCDENNPGCAASLAAAKALHEHPASDVSEWIPMFNTQCSVGAIAQATAHQVDKAKTIAGDTRVLVITKGFCAPAIIKDYRLKAVAIPVHGPCTHTRK